MIDNNFGFIRLSCVSPSVSVADCKMNADEIIAHIKKVQEEQCSVIVFPELSLTSSTCSDLFFQTVILQQAQIELFRIVQETKSSKNNPLVFVGLPLLHNNCLYNTAAVIHAGSVLAIIPKTVVSNENRYFSAAKNENTMISLTDGEKTFCIPFGKNILFQDEQNPHIIIAAEIADDLFSIIPPSINHALAGATIIVNLCANNELAGASQFRKSLIKMHSAKIFCAYVFANAGMGESTTDVVYSGNSFIAENGAILAELPPFSSEQIISADIDIEAIVQERQKNTDFGIVQATKDFHSYTTLLIRLPKIDFSQEHNVRRTICKNPFVPNNKEDLDQRCKEILAIQSYGLIKRLKHTKVKTALIGLSGGLDSTLALLVTLDAFQKLSFDITHIIGITMPCFGTTQRTKNNALLLAQEFGITCKEISIEKAVLQHFSDIAHDPQKYDVTFENAQARERTQVLMDIANQHNGLVIGTGDLSELALGWATYNGDHMSMYGVNASVPKTLIRHLIHFAAKNYEKNHVISKILYDILETPVSPELLPSKDGKISQKTEEIVGPYEMHDFFMYYFLRFGFSPKKIFFLAQCAFASEYSSEDIKKWLIIFLKRFFSQQYKRSCLPDGPKVGSISLSPRGDWKMPSDAEGGLWLEDL